MSAHNNEQYMDLSKCDMPESNNPGYKTNKDSFSKLLNSEAGISSLDVISEKNKIDTLQIIGWNQNVAMSISECFRKRKANRIERVSGEFNKLKESTKKDNEKEALISAFSSWETYVNDPSADTERDFELKSSYYKNM